MEDALSQRGVSRGSPAPKARVPPVRASDHCVAITSPSRSRIRNPHKFLADTADLPERPETDTGRAKRRSHALRAPFEG